MNSDPPTKRAPAPDQVTRPSPETLAGSRREPTEPPEGDWPRILIIEDDGDLRETLKMTLEDAGFVVRTAEDGLDGLERLCEMCPEVDAILLDVMMPVLNGIQFLRVFNKSPARDIPVICISGNVRPPKDELPEGMVFLRKGDLGDPDELIETIRKHVDEGRARRSR